MGLMETWNQVRTPGTTLTLCSRLSDIPPGTTLIVTGSREDGFFSSRIYTVIETTHGAFRFNELVDCAEVTA